MAIATGQITIVDYNDALTLSGFINSNLVKTQMYNPDNGSYIPSWATSPFLVLTPSLYKVGSTADIITSAAVKDVKWFEYVNDVETQITATSNRVLSGTKSHILTIKTNEVAGLSGKDYTCAVTYEDEGTGLELTHKFSISFSRVVNGSGISDAIALAPEGNVFKNGEIASLKATCDLWRGSSIDDTSVTYQWYQQDSTVVTDQGGGVGWKKLTNVSGKYAGVTTRELTIYPDSFTNVGVFKCGIKDTDSESASYNTTFWDVVTFLDNTDPIAVTVSSTGGDTFKNGEGSSVLTARLFQAGSEIDSDGSNYTYVWKKYKKDGTLDTNFNKTGKSISVTGSDVDVKGTFVCEIS